jgi:acetate kinase
MKILVVNAGSSTHKLSLYDLHDEEPVAPLWQGMIDWNSGGHPPAVTVKTAAGVSMEYSLKSRDPIDGIHLLLHSLHDGATQVIDHLQSIERIGHRVVHGGGHFKQPTLITPEVKETIRRLIPLAPLHNWPNLQGIELMEHFFPILSQIAVFDTAFHVSMPEVVKTYPVPWEWKEKGIQRYGFHGISHQYCAERTVKFLKSDPQSLKIINCHLGNGCSLCAIREGKSEETTMGFTPLEGIMMGTRSGSIDPAILLYLLREHQFSSQDLDWILNFESGLKGIGGDSDMRALLRRQGEERVRLAIEMFIHRLKTSIGALAVSLGGFNVLSFTAGIGEHASSIREQVCEGLKCFGLTINQDKNRHCQPDDEVSAASSSIRVLVLHTEEEWMIARACLVKQ